MLLTPWSLQSSIMTTIIRALWGILEICKALLFSVNKRISGGPDAAGHASLHETTTSTTPNFIYSLATTSLVMLEQIDSSHIIIDIPPTTTTTTTTTTTATTTATHPHDAAGGGGGVSSDGSFEEKISLRHCFVFTHHEHQLYIEKIVKRWVLNSFIWENKKLPPTDGVKDKVTNSSIVPKKSHLLYIVPYCMEVGDVSLL